MTTTAGLPFFATRRDIHHLAAVEHLARLGAVEIAFPGGDDDGRAVEMTDKEKMGELV